MTDELTIDTSTDTDDAATKETSLNTQPPQDTGDWHSQLSEEYKNHPSIQKFTDVNGMAKSYLSLESLMGQEKVPIPKNAEDINAWNVVHKAFGVPESPDKYDLKVEGAENLKLDEFKQRLFKNHISQEAAQDLLNAHIEDFKQYKQMEAQAFNDAAAKATADLKQEWGLKYEENLKQANTFLEKMSSSKEEYDYFNNLIGNDAKFIKLLSKMGNSISEGNLGGFEGQNGGFTKTPAEAKQALDEILNNPDDAFWAGARNKRNDMKYCKEHNLSYVSEDERKARVDYVNSLMQMQGQS
jgi:hypothetical protein